LECRGASKTPHEMRRYTSPALRRIDKNFKNFFRGAGYPRFKSKSRYNSFTYKTSRELVNNYDLIAFENLNIKGMVQNHHLAKSISDAGWYQLQTFTAYKAEDAGKQCKFVVSNGTSQECCVCGTIEHLTLADRCSDVQNAEFFVRTIINYIGMQYHTFRYT
jgi:IS605 OrfB family transposase